MMRSLLREKFKSRKLRLELITTSPKILIEGNNWGDTFWEMCGGVGKNWLGLLLMEVRNAL